MYLKYWGFNRLPFENVPSHSLFFRSPQHEEALMRLLYTVENRKGAAMLTGELGSGKTTVGRALMNQLGKDKYEAQTIINPALNPEDFIRALLIALGENADSDSKVVLLDRLQKHLNRNAVQGVNTVIIIDEAHLIKQQASLEEVRMLLNLNSEYHHLITLILLGQTPLIENVAKLKPLETRISVKYHLDPLVLEDTVRYIVFRLKNAGATKGIFTKEAMFPINDFARGVPLRINNLCDRSLLIGFMKKAKVIDTAIVDEAIQDIQ